MNNKKLEMKYDTMRLANNTQNCTKHRTFYVGMYCTRATQTDDYGHTKQLNYDVEAINVEVVRKTQLIRKRAEIDHKRAEPTQPAK